jgi:acetyl esterase/lipase
LKRLLPLIILLLAVCGSISAQQNLRPDAYDVPYDSANHRLDIYLPDNSTPPHPVVMLFHGSPGNKDDFRLLGIPQLLMAQGYAAISVDYTTDLPGAYRDAFCALAWVYANTTRYTLDASKIALLGESYGGLTVAGTAAIDDPARFTADCPRTLPAAYQLSGVISISGVLLPAVDDILPPQYPEQEWSGVRSETAAEILATLRATPPSEWHRLVLPEVVRAYLEQFPLYWVNGSEPPHLLVHGVADHEVPYRESLEYAGVLLEQGVYVQVVFDRLSGHVAPPRVFDQELVTFLRRIFD